MSERRWNGLVLRGDELIYEPTGEDCSNFLYQNAVGEGWVDYGAHKKIAALLAGDPSRQPPPGWSGTAREICVYTGLSEDEIADVYGYSFEALDASQVILTVTQGGSRKLRLHNALERRDGAGPSSKRNIVKDFWRGFKPHPMMFK